MCLQIKQTLNGGGVLGPLCFKLITIVNCYLKTFDMFCLLPKSFVSDHFHCVAPFLIET